MFQVEKRDGTIAEFQMKKITDAIGKAFGAKDMQFSDDMLQMLALRVTADFQSKIKDGKISVEAIQDSVENVLIQCGYAEVAKAYILYRKQREKIRNMKSTIVDYKEIVDSYVKVEDWRVKENSTVTYSVGGLILSNSGAITANYWLSEIYDDEIAEAHRNADIHIHDLSMLTGYCAGWSLKQLIKEGLGGINGKITSSPARHLSVLCNQMVNFLGIMQNEWAGAQAFSSFDTYLAPFVKVDNLSYGEVKKCIEAFIYGVNTPSRWGSQAPFSNITLDWTVPDDLAELPAIVGGKEMDFKYKDCKKEMDMVNKAFIETMIEGDANGRGFQYPIPTYSITSDFDWSDTENNRLLFEMTAKYGTPYFSNYINSDMKPSDVRSMCCRLRLDLRELRKKTGGFFGSGESTGSVGVVTINMPRIAYQSKDEKEFYRILDMVKAREATGMPIVSELMSEDRIPEFEEYVDVVQIGARNMQNFQLLKAVGKMHKPVLLKRGLCNTIEEWIMSAEYIMAGGNEQVILCERGIRTFEKYTRNTLDLSAVPIIHEKTHLPIIVDPSHATGKANLVEPMMIAAVAAGADGLEVEVHYDPQHAWSDGAQCLTPDSFAQAMAKCRQVAWAIGRDM